MILRTLDRIASAYINWRMDDRAAKAEAESGVQFRSASAEVKDGATHVKALFTAGPNMLILLDEACAMLNAADAENYVQFDMIPSLLRHPDGVKPVRVTLQWAHGESPATQNARLRDELSALRAQASDLKPALEALIGEISEECYSAGWYSGIEYRVWSLIQDDGWWDRTTPWISGGRETALLGLSALMGGWVMWDDEADEVVFVPMDEWETRYAAHIA